MSGTSSGVPSNNFIDFDIEGLDADDTAAGRRRTLNPSAMRELIPVSGLRESWYPAIVEHKVGRRRPTKIKLLDEDVVLYRNKSGGVVACAAVCPHRGGSMGDGHCHYAGTISCPYHGWTFDETGDCVAVLGEGPESPIPGNEGARLRMYPTVTLKGCVFIWMGQGEPAPLEEDIPAQFFLDNVHIQYSITNWRCNWRQAIENLIDAHAFYVHHNSARWMLESGPAFLAGSKMGPNGRRPQVVNGRAVRLVGGFPFRYDLLQRVGTAAVESVSENSLYRDPYPGLNGQRWPKHESRYTWARLLTKPMGRIRPKPDQTRPWQIDEWISFHLPTIFQNDKGTHIYTRYVVPVHENLSRVFYLHSTHAHSKADRFLDMSWFKFVYNWTQNYNFSGQDQGVMEPQRYDTAEALSATDVFPLAVRRLIVERARDFQETKPAD